MVSISYKLSGTKKCMQSARPHAHRNAMYTLCLSTSLQSPASAASNIRQTVVLANLSGKKHKIDPLRWSFRMVFQDGLLIGLHYSNIA